MSWSDERHAEVKGRCARANKYLVPGANLASEYGLGRDLGAIALYDLPDALAEIEWLKLELRVTKLRALSAEKLAGIWSQELEDYLAAQGKEPTH